jgi:hypothetical protein
MGLPSGPSSHGRLCDDLFAVPDALALEATLMPRTKELFELARQCYVQANNTLNPEAKKTLQDIGHQYVQKAEELRRIGITRAANDKKVG